MTEEEKIILLANKIFEDLINPKISVMDYYYLCGEVIGKTRIRKSDIAGKKPQKLIFESPNKMFISPYTIKYWYGEKLLKIDDNKNDMSMSNIGVRMCDTEKIIYERSAQVIF